MGKHHQTIFPAGQPWRAGSTLPPADLTATWCRLHPAGLCSAVSPPGQDSPPIACALLPKTLRAVIVFLRQESLTLYTTISPLAFILHIQIWDIIMVFKVRSGHINHLILLVVSVIRIFPVVTRTSQVRPSRCKHPVTAHTTGCLPFSLCGLYLEV